MKLLAFIGWLLPACVVFGQASPLPYIKDGKWCLVDTTGKLLRETDYTFIQTYDAAGFTFFAQNGAYGIMDRAGTTVIPAQYADIRQNGHGHYSLLTPEGWLQFTPQTYHLMTQEAFSLFEPLSDSWALTGKRDSLFLQNLPTGAKWFLKDSTLKYNLVHDHVLLSLNDTTQQLLNPGGETLLAGRRIALWKENELCDASVKDTHYLFDANGPWEIPGIRSVTHEETGVFIRTAREGLYCRYDRSVILRGDYERIFDIDRDFYCAVRKGFSTLIDKQTLKLALPFRYEDIFPTGDGNYQVYLNGSGLLDAQFRELIPCRYTRFSLNGDLATVWDENYTGLFSLKTRRELIPAVYNTITRTGMRFKAIRNELITIVEIDAEHRIVKTAKIDNVLSIRQASTGDPNRKRKTIDPRLFSVGWFVDSIYVTPPNAPGFFSVKLGLRNPGDSVLIKPSLSELKYLVSAPYTLQYTGRIPYVTATGGTQNQPVFRPIYLPKGKILSGLALLSYDSLDFVRRDFMRVSTKDGFGILDGEGVFRQLSYVEKGANSNLRYCESKTITVTTKDNELMTEVPSLSVRGDHIDHPVLRDHPGKNIKGFLYPDGKWNYFGTDGKPLFAEPFTYAHPFVGAQAIVKQKAWGVVSADTVLIPTIYNRIERKVFEKDTFFIVQLSQSGNRLLDTLSHTIPAPAIVAATPHNFIVEKAGLKVLCDVQLHELSEGYTSMKFLKNGLILAKMKKEYTLFNAEGAQLFNGAEEPEAVYFENAFVFKEGGGLVLKDAQMNLLNESCSSIERHGRLLAAKRGGEWFVYDERLTLLAERLTGKLIVDTSSGQFAVSEAGKTSVYDAAGKRIAKLKNTEPTQFINGRLLVAEKDSCRVLATDGKQTAAFAGFQSAEVLENGAVFIRIRRGSNLLFDRNWTPVLPEETKFRQLVAVGPAIYGFSSASGKQVLYNAETDKTDSNHLTVQDVFHNDRLLVGTPTGFLYVDTDFRPLTKVTFSKAVPFNGNYAAVADQRGWTLIDRNCKPLGYPNFGTISAVNPQVFQTSKLPLQGVFDSNGKALIPVQYEQIRFLPSGIILCVKEGSFYYFRKDGKQLL